MTDTPQAVKDLQLKIWLSKSPGERLHILMRDNEEIFKLWGILKEQYNKTSAEKNNSTNF